MPDEEIDKIIRDAANQHHPPYDDAAWGKMELLLDKHLPQKKDRKRPIIFLVFFLLLGGATFFAVENARKKMPDTTTVTKSENQITTAQNNTVAATGTSPGNTSIAENSAPVDQVKQTTNQPVTAANDANANKLTSTSNADVTILQSSIKPPGTSNSDNYANSKKNKYSQKERFAMKVKKPVSTYDNNVETEKNKPSDNNTKNIVTTKAPSSATNSTTDETVNNDTDKNTVAGKEDIVKATDTANKTKPDAAKTTTEKDNTKNTTAQKKNNKSVADRLAITISAGGDVSYISINNAGKLKPVIGAGLSYTLGKHFTINSGFYASKKIYSGQPNQYKFSTPTYPGLTKINADCYIYEIPLSVYYKFKAAKKHNWLAGAGLSSFLMKKENYDYIYQYPGGQTYVYPYNIANENKHFFAVLTLSAGYQYKLSNRLSFIAEPYVKVPLSGVGAGKVKLNSAGVLITAAIKPFTKKKK